jgi:fatty-acyl-CoA synthase
MNNPYDIGLDRGSANYEPLTPISFLNRAAAVYPERVAWVYGAQKIKYKDFAKRCRRLASALSKRGIGVGHTVAVMAPNIPPLLELHFGVPMVGAVLNAINTRLEASTIAYILAHGEAKMLITDREFSEVVGQAIELLENPPVVIDINDVDQGNLLGGIDYEALLSEGEEAYALRQITDEWNAISLSYTSGTTGDPKGVVYHHRGAYLNAIGNVMAWNMPPHPTYLWTLPMFHCNGWCFPWTIVAQGGTQVCLRDVRADAVWDLLREESVTHLCGAPIVLNLLIESAKEMQRAITQTINIMTAASPPPPPVLSAIEKLGFSVTHAYGLTECYGPGVVCAWQEEWDTRPVSEKALLKARQGVRYPSLEELIVADPVTMKECPADGVTIGEVMMRGNIIMKGYFKDPDATSRAFKEGWFRTGDLGVMHADGYIELKDRSKDIIISGGENISSIEVETVLYDHPCVSSVAVVARPDAKWGETPCAFVELKSSQPKITEQDIIEFCRSRLAHYKCPKTVVFGSLAKTSTGKIQKFVLRERTKFL